MEASSFDQPTCEGPVHIRPIDYTPTTNSVTAKSMESQYCDTTRDHCTDKDTVTEEKCAAFAAGLPALLNIPAEMRLEINKRLITDYLATGATEGLMGLHLSCREIHNEMKKEFVTKIRPLLMTQS